MYQLKLSSHLFSLLLLLAACGGGGGSSSDITGSKDRIEAADVTIPGNNTQATLYISANCSWVIKEEIDWLSVNPQQGTGSQNVTVTTTGVNPSSTEERIGTLIITNNGEAEHRVTVRQLKASETLQTNVSTLTFSEGKSFQDITITSNNEWHITGQTDWLYLDRYDGTGSATVRVNVEANSTSGEREAVLRITANSGLYATVTVKQAGKRITLSLSPSTLAVRPEGDTKTLSVECNGDWTASCSQSWVQIDNSIGSGNATLTLSVAQNTSGAARSATVTLASGTLRATCTVSQDYVSDGDKPSEGDNPLPGI